jgi:hypothetical protein
MFRDNLRIAIVTGLVFAVSNVGAISTLNAAEVGVALTPANFPSHTSNDVTEMFRLGKEAGDVAVFIYQWSQPDFKTVAAKVIEASRAAGLKPVLSLSPTKLEGARGELDLPAQVRQKAGRQPSFKDKNVYMAYITDVLDLARLKPPFLCLATEINMLAFRDINEYVAFAHIYKKLYPEIKKISPATKVFVSFQWDFYYIMDTKDPNKISEHSKLIDIFRPELDIVAFTSYPASHFPEPSAIPTNYYDKILTHTHPGDQIAFTEIGWPSQGKGSQQAQEQFITRLPGLLAKTKPFQVDWSLLHDVSIGALNADLSTTGLLTRTGGKKPAFKAFQQLRKQL